MMPVVYTAPFTAGTAEMFETPETFALELHPEEARENRIENFKQFVARCIVALPCMF